MTRVLSAAALLAAALASLWGGAQLTTEQFYWSRIIAWRDSAFRDFETKFPARDVARAGPISPLRRPLAQEVSVLRTVTYTDARGGVHEAALDSFLAATGTTAFLVLRDDTLVVERYANGSGHNAIQTSFSVAKSFVSAMVGAAIARGHIGSVEDPLIRYVPELAGRGMDGVTIRHLLTMSSGLRYDGGGSGGMPWQDDARTYYEPNLRRLALSVRPAQEPGKAWQYNNYHPLLLGLILERATGRSVSDFLSDAIWQPLGMESTATWSMDSRHSAFEKMESGINARAVDFARFARLYLRRGEWYGRQVLPAEWVDVSTRCDAVGDPADFYQYLWWVDTERPGRYYAAGHLGQYLYVAPDRDKVVVRFGRSFGGLHHESWVALLRSIADRS